MKRKGANASDFLPWYREGLPFECTGCGNCCTGSEGYVWVDEEEITAMADFLRLSADQFGVQYLRQVGRSRYSLLEDRTTGDCVFLARKQCAVYPVRPKQCRTYPFWSENLASPANWQAAARECRGIGQGAPLVPYREIIDQLD